MNGAGEKGTEKVSASRRSSPLKAFLVAAVLLVVPVFASLGAYVSFRHSLHAQIEDRLDEIRAQGYPVTLEELEAWYVYPPEDENASLAIGAAMAHSQALAAEEMEQLPVAGDGPNLPDSPEPLPAEMRERIDAYLALKAECLRMLHEASDLREARWPIDLTEGSAVPLYHLSLVRLAARMLDLEAVCRAEDGDAAGAVESVLACLAMRRSVEQEPNSTSQILRTAYTNLSLDALEHVLNRLVLAEDQLVSLDEALSDAERCNGFARGMVGDRCVCLNAMQNAAGSDLGWLDAPLWLQVVYGPLGFREMDTLRYLDVMARVITMAESPPETRPREMKAIEAEIQATPAHLPTSQSLLVAVSSLNAGEVSDIARIRVARAVLAIERHRLATASLPESWEDLVPAFMEALPIDPFDSQPLRYRQQDDGFLVYSIGEDFEDDNGQRWKYGSPKFKKYRDADIVFEVRRPSS